MEGSAIDWENSLPQSLKMPQIIMLSLKIHDMHYYNILTAIIWREEDTILKEKFYVYKKTLYN